MKNLKKRLICLLACCSVGAMTAGMAACSPEWFLTALSSGLNSGSEHVHVWGEGEITDAPTCTEAGERTYTCECKEKKTETIPAFGHNWTEEICENCDQSQFDMLEYELVEETIIDADKNETSVQYYKIVGIGTCPAEDLVLPAEREGVKVTQIADSAFKDCSNLKSVKIPSSITKFGADAFSGCIALDKVYYAGKVTDWCGIEFIGQKSNPLSYGSALYLKENDEYTMVTKLSAEDLKGMGSIKSFSFAGCSSLTSLALPETAVTVGEYAFYNCLSLMHVEISSSVESIGSNAFEGCHRLIEVCNKSNLSVESGKIAFGYVGYYAKYVYERTDFSIGSITNSDGETVSLNVDDPYIFTTESLDVGTAEKAVISDQDVAELAVRDIIYKDGKATFQVTKIETKTGSDSEEYTEIECKVLSACTLESFDEFFFVADESRITTNNDRYVLYTNGDEVVLLAYTGTATELVLPESVTAISAYAFYGNSNITSVSVGSAVKSIGAYAFFGCESLTGVTLSQNSGWSYATTADGANGSEFSAADLSDTAKAAEYLTDEYFFYYWMQE